MAVPVAPAGQEANVFLERQKNKKKMDSGQVEVNLISLESEMGRKLIIFLCETFNLKCLLLSVFVLRYFLNESLRFVGWYVEINDI